MTCTARLYLISDIPPSGIVPTTKTTISCQLTFGHPGLHCSTYGSQTTNLITITWLKDDGTPIGGQLFGAGGFNQ